MGEIYIIVQLHYRTALSSEADFPENVSVGTLESATSSTSALSAQQLSDSARIYVEIFRVVKRLNKSHERNAYVVNWAEVQAALAEANPTYKTWTKEQVKNKFKYFNRVRKSLRKK